MAIDVLLFGCARQSLPAFRETMSGIDCVIFDIRESGASAHAVWCGRSLQRVCGEQYRHVAALSPLPYCHGATMGVRDLDTGIEMIRAEPRTVILLCECSGEKRKCHRFDIGDALTARGFHVQPLVLVSGP